MSAGQLFVDSLDFARNAGNLLGKVRVADLPRLQDKLAASEGELSYVVRGYLDKYSRPMLELKLDGLCQLRCQRCLQGMPYPIKVAARLLLVQTEEMDPSYLEDDEIDSIPVDAHLDVLHLLEEELLLSLPFAPRHPVDGCEQTDIVEKVDQTVTNSFAVLAELKNK